MNHAGTGLAAGLYLVATPIGAARDITLRALDILAQADELWAEDTRSLRHLLTLHGVSLGARPLRSYHDHSDATRAAAAAGAIAGGGAIAYCSEAGTPMVSDPGYGLVRAVAAAGGQVIAAPGASAVLTALAVAGLPTDRFLFMGFLPSKAGARRAALDEVAGLRSTLVFYESPRRVAALLAELSEVLGPAREAAFCRELTKRFEEVRRAPLGDLARDLAGQTPKGECVLVIGPPVTRAASAEDLDGALRAALTEMSLRDASAAVAEAYGMARKTVYRRALELAAERDG